MAFKDGKTYITVSTDAGFKDGIVTYAVWISTEKGKFQYSGMAKKLYSDSNEAELIAICHGISHIYNHHKDILESCDVLVFNTDSQNAIRAIERPLKNHKYTPMTDYFYSVFDKLKKQYKFQFKIRHVKGHASNKLGARNFVNNWCDKMSTELRKQYYINQSNK